MGEGGKKSGKSTIQKEEAKRRKSKLRTNDAEREFAHATELSNNRSVFVTAVVDGEPVVGTVLDSGSDFLHWTRDEVLAPVGQRMRKSTEK